MDELKPTVVKQELVYEGRVFEVSVSDALSAAGNPMKIEIVHHPGGASAIPVSAEGKIALVRQYRFPPKRFCLEIPAGRINRGDTPLESARRELEEEVGVLAHRMESLCEFYPTPGYCEERLYVYLATELEQTRQNLDSDEEIEVYWLAIDEALSLVRSGEIDDAKTIIALLLVEREFSRRGWPPHAGVPPAPAADS